MSPAVAPPTRWARHLGARAGLLLAVAGLLLVGVAWAISTPVFGYPDEGSHVTRAAAVVDGQPVAPDRPVSAEGWPIIRAPNSLARSISRARCLWSGPTHPNVPASCALPLPPFHRMVEVRNAAGHYEPVYYAVVGGPLRLAPSTTGVYAARIINVVAAAALLAVALLAAGLHARDRPWWRLALLVGLTPYVLYITGGINPSAWEICAAVGTWAAVLRLIEDGVAPIGLVALTTVSASVLAISRPLGPLWVLVIGAVVAAVTPWVRLRALLAARAVQAGIAVVGASCVASLGWTAAQAYTAFDTSLLHHPLPFWTAFEESFARLPRRLEEMVAVFGWRDVPVPLVTRAVWIALAALLLGVALWRGAPRLRWTLLGLVTVTVLAPALLEAHMATRIGMVWQGRYTLPLAVGLPLLAGHALTAREAPLAPPRWLLPVAATAAAVAQVAAFLWALRRYEHGVPGSWNPFTGAWLPPGGAVLSIALFVAGIAALYAGIVVRRLTRASDVEPVVRLWAGAGSNRRPSAFQADARTD